MNRAGPIITAKPPTVSGWPNFMVSTTTAVLVWKPTSIQVVRQWDTDNGLPYYGVTWDDSLVYVCEASTRSRTGRDCLVALNPRDWSVARRFAGYFPAAHQIHSVEGKVAITVTQRNAVALVDTSSGQEAFYNWTGHDTDVNHLNSIWRDGEHWWVNYHNYAEKEHTRETNSRVVRIDSNFETIDIDISIGVGVHNVVRTGDLLYLTSSVENRLLVYDLSSKSVIHEVSGLSWARGLGLTDKYIVVGASEVHSDRKARLVGNSKVFLLSRDTLDILDYVVLQNTGPIYDLRVTSDYDYAHNGIPFPEERQCDE